MVTPNDDSSQRLDVWLWAARFFKTRSLSVSEIEKGRIDVNQMPAKPAKAVRVGDLVSIRRPGIPAPQVLTVLAIAKTRGPASVAQALFAETEASKVAAAQHKEAMRLAPEPSASLNQGRPTKRDRRDLTQAKSRWQRWSASVDDKR